MLAGSFLFVWVLLWIAIYSFWSYHEIMLCLMAACCYGNCWDMMTNTVFKFYHRTKQARGWARRGDLGWPAVPGSNWQSQWERVWKLRIVGGQRAILIQLPSNLQAFGESWDEPRYWCCHFGGKRDKCLILEPPWLLEEIWEMFCCQHSCAIL